MPESVFEPIKIEWEGQEYEIPANRILGLIEQIETHVSYLDLLGNYKLARISKAYGAALRYADADVTDDQVYEKMFDGASAGQVQKAVNGMLAMMIPPKHLQKKTEESKPKRATRRKKPKD